MEIESCRLSGRVVGDGQFERGPRRHVYDDAGPEGAKMNYNLPVHRLNANYASLIYQTFYCGWGAVFDGR